MATFKAFGYLDSKGRLLGVRNVAPEIGANQFLQTLTVNYEVKKKKAINFRWEKPTESVIQEHFFPRTKERAIAQLKCIKNSKDFKIVPIKVEFDKRKAFVS